MISNNKIFFGDVMDIFDEIKKLKKEKNAVILAHNYQNAEVLKIADYLGDSLKLSLISREVDADIIVFAGVKFMAEQTKVLNMDKTVLIPDPGALCSLAAMINSEILKSYKERYPDAPVVTYVNSPLEIKALSDYIVTSANALEVISKIDSDTIIFTPDSNLGSWISRKTEKKIINVPPAGHCYVHLLITRHDVLLARKKYPEYLVIVHPEVPEDTKDVADFVGSTGQMIEYIKNSKEKKFLIGTEVGMINRLKLEFPDKEFIPIVDVAKCIGMKKITVEKICASLKDNIYEIHIQSDIAKKVRKAIERTFSLMGVK